VPQDIYLLDETIKKNIALGLNDEMIDENQVKFSLQAAQLDSLINSLPEGLDTIVGERGVRLSGGQRQRIGIARALYTNPDIIILDEATSSLDFETEKNIMDAIDKLKGIKTLIIVSHRMSTIQDCDKIYEIQNNSLRLK
jgi:ABC-type multidrug transport system fused ATPase/permease subunit